MNLVFLYIGGRPADGGVRAEGARHHLDPRQTQPPHPPPPAAGGAGLTRLLRPRLPGQGASGGRRGRGGGGGEQRRPGGQVHRSRPATGVTFLTSSLNRESYSYDTVIMACNMVVIICIKETMIPVS
jgi:hypothetical protein